MCFFPVCHYSSMCGRQWDTKLLSCVRMEPRSMAVAELAGVISLALRNDRDRAVLIRANVFAPWAWRPTPSHVLHTVFR